MAIDRCQTDRAVDDLRGPLVELARRLHDNPELRWEEHRAAAWISQALAQLGGVRVGRAGGYPAFRARAGSGVRPRVALAEYDALPDRHACGRNLIAGGAVGAFVALARLGAALPGTVGSNAAEEERAGIMEGRDGGEAANNVADAVLASPTSGSRCASGTPSQPVAP